MSFIPRMLLRNVFFGIQTMQIHNLPDFGWSNRLTGVSFGVKKLAVGPGWLQAYAWGSYQVHPVSQFEIVNATACIVCPEGNEKRSKGGTSAWSPARTV